MSHVRKNIRFFLIKLVEKLRERSPLKYGLTFYLLSLSPIYITDATTMSLCSRFKKLLKCLDECGWISSKTADTAEKGYRKFISEVNIMEEFSKFEMSDRLDEFYTNFLDNTKMKL